MPKDLHISFKVFLECCIYWVGFPFRNSPGTQPIARSEVYLSFRSNQLAAMQLSTAGKAPVALTRGQAVPRLPLLVGQVDGAGGGAVAGTEALYPGCGSPHLRAGTGSLTTGVQVLPAEGGVHRVQDRAARAGRAPPSPQLRPQPLARGHVTRCSCASRPAWEPMPPRNRGSPVLPRQRSICQGQ